MISVKPLLTMGKDEVQTYWQTLYMYDTLRFRLCDLDSPTWSDVLDMIVRMGQNMYCILDDGRIVGEFMLEGFTGKSAQIHFSMHPDNKYKDTLTYARYTLDQILNHWKHKDGTWYLDSLYGIIPISNRASCITCLKSGFRKIGILPSGMRCQGRIEDATITVMEASDGR
jgi:hypothetical protein